LGVEARIAASAEIRRRVIALPEWAAARTVGLYAAQGTEPNLNGLLDAPGKTFCFPRVSGEGLVFRRCQSLEQLQPGPWNLLEPDPAQCPVVPAPEIDMLLIPGLAFTRTGGRLGRGGGFYDRFLTRAHPRAVTVGVCFAVQLLDALPLEAHDHEVDCVVTEASVVRAR
jgi:5-formyltetrahydrofolate cyclo-ligase